MILEIPRAVTVEWEERLRNFGLVQARTIEVWPAGLGAVAWDGEGHGEWLVSERPCLGIVTDHPISSIVISIDGDATPSLELTSLEPGEPAFIELPQFSVGMHRVHFSIASELAGETERLGDLEVAMSIRDPRPWSPGINPHGPFHVEMDPQVSTLEQIWEGQTDVSVQGPSGRKIKCRVSLFRRDSDTAIYAKQIGPIQLPVTSYRWRDCFEQQFRSVSKAQKAYDLARFCELKFSADELGSLTVRCEREFSPLRWILQRKHSGSIVRLLDDSGESKGPEVVRMPFERPCNAKELSSESLTYRVPDLGGMYVAQTVKFTAQIIAPPFRMRDFSALRCVPRVEPLNRSVESVIRMVKTSRLWGRAKLPGDILSKSRQRTVIRKLALEVSRLVCGNNWARAESVISEGTAEEIESLSRAVSTDLRTSCVGNLLFQELETLSRSTCVVRVRRLASIAAECRVLPVTLEPRNVGGSVGNQRLSNNIDSPEWLAELALRLTSDPANVESWAGSNLRTGIARLLETPILARAARFLVITTDQELGQPDFRDIYTSWRWE